MNNYLVYEPASKIREIAREALRGKWKEMFLGMLIYFALSTAMTEVLSYFFATVKYIPLSTGYYFQYNMNFPGELYSLLVTGCLQCGLAMFLLAFFRKRTINYGLTLEGFSMFGKAFFLFLLYSVKIFLWTLLFVVPGIIAILRYSQCFYLRVDNPDWTASQCIKESTRLMTGNKGKFFGLTLSFIGWLFLAALVGSFFELSNITGIAYLVLSILTALPLLVVQLYMEMSKVAFYEILIGNLVVTDSRGARYDRHNAGNETWAEVQSKKDENDKPDNSEE